MCYVYLFWFVRVSWPVLTEIPKCVFLRRISSLKIHLKLPKFVLYFSHCVVRSFTFTTDGGSGVEREVTKVYIKTELYNQKKKNSHGAFLIGCFI